LLWRSRDPDARRWLLLAALLIFLRLGFFATLENPEPRYTVEILPFLIILAGAGAASLTVWVKAKEMVARMAAPPPDSDCQATSASESLSTLSRRV